MVCARCGSRRTPDAVDLHRKHRTKSEAGRRAYDLLAQDVGKTQQGSAEHGARRSRRTRTTCRRKEWVEGALAVARHRSIENSRNRRPVTRQRLHLNLRRARDKVPAKCHLFVIASEGHRRDREAHHLLEARGPWGIPSKKYAVQAGVLVSQGVAWSYSEEHTREIQRREKVEPAPTRTASLRSEATQHHLAKQATPRGGGARGCL
jgi:hypothetical protein